MKRLLYIALALLAGVVLQASDSVPFLEKLKASLHRFNQRYPEEKVYLQLDKPFYKPGEDIWFNAFVLEARHHTPTQISDVVYVELIDPRGNVASRLELFVKDGASRGDFKLTDHASGGLYTLKAYTQWMKNGGIENVFRKKIQVQTVITPRLLLKLDFEKEAYGPGDMVKAKLTAKNLKNETVAATIKYTVALSGQQVFFSELQASEQGTATLTFTLPTDLKTSDGLLQAIVADNGVEESISRAIPIVLNHITLQFFPEGGDLLDGVTNSVAFKAVNEFGKGADVSGEIRDENDRFVCDFESYHMGMGAFSFRPKSGKRYHAVLKTPAGIAATTPLPTPRSEGFALHKVSQDPSEISFAITAPFVTTGYLVGQIQGEIYHAEKITLQKGSNTIPVNTKSFPPGVAVFTVFDAQGLEQCERLVFVNPDRQMSVKLTPDKKQYQPREKVSLHIETSNDKGHPIPAKLSLAVADDQLISLANDKQDNILSWFLLSSEVKGEIQEPSFYFNKEEPKASQALDYLLMTQGWRRFRWHDLDTEKSLTYTPEKEGLLFGQVTDDKDRGVDDEVTLVELNNKRRIIKVRATADGNFLFKNTDATTPMLLLTNSANHIILQKENTRASAAHLPIQNDAILYDAKRSKTVQDNSMPAVVPSPRRGNGAGLNLRMQEDVQSLSEVVVVGYGASERRDFAACVTVIRTSDWIPFVPVTNIEGAMQGRVAGVMVTPQNGNAGASSNVRLRGFGSLSGGNEPLFVIDGVPVATSLNGNFATSSLVGPDDVESITVLHSPEASALYGSRAANGVIVINTRSRLYFGGYSERKRRPRYSHVTVQPRAFTATREFYAPSHPKNEQPDERRDFRTTVYWNPSVVTDEKGEATVSFYNADAVSSFRITAEGISGRGLLGRKEETYFTQLPFSLDAKLPEFIGYEDTLKIQVRIKNTTSKILAGELTLDIPDELMASTRTLPVNVGASTTETVVLTLIPKAKTGRYPIAIRLTSHGRHDEIRQTLQVHPVGFPVQLDFGAKTLDTLVHFSVHDIEQGSLQATFVAFPDVISDLFHGAESILSEPHGCFEQVSSSAFPNILALQFMQQSGRIDPTVNTRALDFIKDGYKRLAAYEIAGGGFEWFGHPPAHEALSAYGLVEFYEMKKVYPNVDDAMLKRTRHWLLSRRDNQGGFNQNRGKYGFSAAPAEVNNAYIVYALALTGSTDIQKEYETARDEAWKSKDPYRMALVANAAFTLGALEDYHRFVNYFLEVAHTRGLISLSPACSITYSWGKSLLQETLGFWVQALAREGYAYSDMMTACIQHILQYRSYGGFGSTQATTVCLQALTTYARAMRTAQEGGEIQLTVNSQPGGLVTYQKGTQEKLTLNNFGHNLTSNGPQSIRVAFDKTKQPIPFHLQLQWSSKTPVSSDLCKVGIKTSLLQSAVHVNETVRMNVTLTNKTHEGLPMTLAVVGIPGGLSAQPWQLKALQEKGAFDFYEIIGDRIAFYYREMGPSAVHVIALDLKAEVAGRYTGAANSAYLYYNNESKDWSKGLTIGIR
ncbi:MAG TPA: MG2 domain-containing protein [Chryseolinea sp.]